MYSYAVIFCIECMGIELNMTECHFNFVISCLLYPWHICTIWSRMPGTQTGLYGKCWNVRWACASKSSPCAHKVQSMNQILRAVSNAFFAVDAVKMMRHNVVSAWGYLSLWILSSHCACTSIARISIVSHSFGFFPSLTSSLLYRTFGGFTVRVHWAQASLCLAGVLTLSFQ